MSDIRNYKKIQKEIIINGFFSEYLPPCFNINASILNLFKYNKNDYDLIPPISFTMSKFTKSNARRTIYIPEICSYLNACIYARDNNIIEELVEFSDNDVHSFSKDLGDNDEIIRFDHIYTDIKNKKYIENVSKKIILSAGAKKILKLDISNCFSSFYLHMIPAIILGVEDAQKQFYNLKEKKASEKYKIYNKFDSKIRRQNLNRTNGLLVGPLLSKIIAESLLSRIDSELDAKGYNFIRYMDDYEIFLYEDNEKEIINKIETILKRYNFSLNSEKSEIIEFPYYVINNFNNILNNISERIDKEELINIFDYFFKIEKQDVKGSIRYLSKISKFIIEKIEEENIELGISYLLTIMRNDEKSLPKICELFVKKKSELVLNQNNIKIIKDFLKLNLNYRNDLEVFWLTYTLLELDQLKDDEKLIEEIITYGHELSCIILLKYNVLNDNKKIKISKISSSWIALYELFYEDVIDKKIFCSKLNLNKNIGVYNSFKLNKINFVKQYKFSDTNNNLSLGLSTDCTSFDL